MRRLDALVRATVPELEPHVRDGMLAYGAYRYRYKSGREGDGARIAIGATARAVALHAVALVAADEHLVERYADRLGEHARVGRTTVHFSQLELLDLEALRELLLAAATLPPPGVVNGA